MGGAGTNKIRNHGETQGETSVCIPVIPRPVRGFVCIFILLVADWVVKVCSDSGNKPTDDLHPPLPIGENWPGIVPTEDDQLSTAWSTTSVVSCAVMFVAVVMLVTAAIVYILVYIRSER